MKLKNCHACGQPLDDGTAWARVTFDGFTASALNGTTFLIHARCLSLNITATDYEMPPRISDPVAEAVDWSEAVA